MFSSHQPVSGFISRSVSYIFCIYVLLAGTCSCLKPEKDEGGDNSQNTSVQLRAEREALVRNPLNGWVMYLGRSWNEDFWTNPDVPYSPYDAMPTSEGSTVKVSDYASTAYLRTSWASLEPEEGSYVWRDPESTYSKMLKSCLDRGLRLAFRIVIDGRDQGQNTPLYVFRAGASCYDNNGVRTTADASGIKSPYPDDPVFQEKYEKFLAAFAEDFNDIAKVDFIDGFSLGKWGEAHALIFNDNSSKLPVFEWMTDLYSRLFTEVPLFVNYHRLLGDANQDSWSDSPSPDTESMIESAVRKGYSIRHDAFGMYTYYRDWERGIAAKYNFVCPIAMEGGWITDGTHRYWIYDAEPYRENHPEDVRQGEYDMSAEARVNMMDLRVHSEIQTFFQLKFDLVKSFIANGGYRLCPALVSVPENVCTGDRVTLTSRWSNYGWGYCPNNIPAFNWRYKGAFALFEYNDGSLGKLAKVFVDEKIEPSEWRLNSPVSYSTEIDLSGIPAGTYMWAIGIVDTAKGNVPGLNMAVTSSRLTEDGWAQIIAVEVK